MQIATRWSSFTRSLCLSVCGHDIHATGWFFVLGVVFGVPVAASTISATGAGWLQSTRVLCLGWDTWHGLDCLVVFFEWTMNTCGTEAVVDAGRCSPPRHANLSWYVVCSLLKVETYCFFFLVDCYWDRPILINGQFWIVLYGVYFYGAKDFEIRFVLFILLHNIVLLLIAIAPNTFMLIVVTWNYA